MGFNCKSSTNSHLYSSIFLFEIVTLILIFSSNTISISFNFTDFATNDPRINLEGDSIRNGTFIELTRNNASLYYNLSGTCSVGRAVYSEAIQLWNATTGWQTDFDTHFSFIIDGRNQTYVGDGLAFFLAPFGSKLPPDSNGHGLGLITRGLAETYLATNQIVAVEFDSHKNRWDPSSDHVGININSVVSVDTVSLANRAIRDGRKANARVTYKSTTKNLTVFLSYGNNHVFSESSMLSYIVDLSMVLPERITIGFAAATGTDSEIHQVLSWQFSSTVELNDKKTGEVQTDSKGKGNKTGLAVGLGVGLGVLGCGLGFALFIWLKKRRRSREFEDDAENSDMSMDDAFENGTGPKRFSYNELVHATNNFNEETKLGQGGFGGVYQGLLSDKFVAVKRISKGSQQGKKEYQSEVKVISQLRHRNLVQLIGWCHERNELLLVYMFMQNRSLDKHLFQGRNYVLNWESRYKIVLGLASALVYLHEGWEQCVVHRDIKSSNIMLDSDFNAKLGDFGLARLVDHDQRSKTTAVAGTKGYLAPECMVTGKFNKKSDVYSFGIVALEIACGRKPVLSSGELLSEWVWNLYGRGKLVDQGADERLRMQFNESEMEQLMVVGLWCAHPDSKSRPSVSQVINVLKFGSPLPNLPPKFPSTSRSLPGVPYLRHVPSCAGLTDTLVGR